MIFFRLLLLSIPLMFVSNFVHAQSAPDIIDPGTGTFPMEGRMEEEDRDREEMEEEQLEMEKEEVELDSFGEDKYNSNVDPDVYKGDIKKSDEILK